MEQTFEQVYAANRGMIKTISGKVYGRLLSSGASMPYEDIEQEATIAMMRAWERFDPSLGFKFSTYYYRAAYNELNRFVEPYCRDVDVLDVMSIQAASDDEGETFNSESSIDGGHEQPDQVLEAKQLMVEIESKLSPLAFALVKLMMEPPEHMTQEWQSWCATRGVVRAEMTMSFAIEYLAIVTGLNRNEVRRASLEVNKLRKELNA